jgi:hypothetical protein
MEFVGFTSPTTWKKPFKDKIASGKDNNNNNNHHHPSQNHNSHKNSHSMNANDNI